jgi:Protein of unknown function (DUF2959)
MKSQNQRKSETLMKCRAIIALGVAGLTLVGCSSAPYRKGDAAAISLQDAASDVQGQSRALEVAMGTLDDLVNKPEMDLKPQFKRFSKAVDTLAADARRNNRSEARISKKSAAYFDEWNKQLADMNYDVVRERSQARKNEVAKYLDSVDQRYREAQDAMGPLLSYLYDVRKALDNDLTPAGVESIKPIAGKARENADKVQLALGRLTSELTVSGNRMSSVVYQNANTPPTGTNQPPQRSQSDGS